MATTKNGSKGVPRRPQVVAERNESEVGPPQSVEVEAVPRVVLYAHDGTPLTRRIGY